MQLVRYRQTPNIHAQKTAHGGCFCVSRVYTLKNLANFTSKRHTFYMFMQIYYSQRMRNIFTYLYSKYTTNERDK